MRQPQALHRSDRTACGKDLCGKWSWSLTPLCHRLTCQVTSDKVQLPEGHSCTCTQSQSADLGSFGFSARAYRCRDGPETQTQTVHTDILPGHTLMYTETCPQHTHPHTRTHPYEHRYTSTAHTSVHRVMLSVPIQQCTPTCLPIEIHHCTWAPG